MHENSIRPDSPPKFNDPLHAHSYRPITSQTVHITQNKSEEIGRALANVTARCMNRDFIKEKATNAIIAKVAPLTTPPDLKIKIRNDLKNKVILGQMIESRKEGLRKIDDKLALVTQELNSLEKKSKKSAEVHPLIDTKSVKRSSPSSKRTSKNSSNPPSPKEKREAENKNPTAADLGPTTAPLPVPGNQHARVKLKRTSPTKSEAQTKGGVGERLTKLMETKIILENSKDHLLDQLARYEARLQAVQQGLAYLNNQSTLQIAGRFTGYAGHMANAIIPGSGTLISVALTAVNAAAQEQLVNTIPVHQASKDLVAKEKSNARHNTMLTVACTVSSVFFGIYILPVVKETAWYLWNYKPA